jgi:hypothetical protein
MRALSRRGAWRTAGENEQNEQQAAGTAAAGDRRTRRRLLAGAAGVLGVAAAEAVGRAAPAQADNTQPVLQGVDNGYLTRRPAVFSSGNKEFAQLADPGTAGLGSQGCMGAGSGEAANGTGVIGQAGLTGGSGGGNNTGVAGIGSGTGAGVTGKGGSSGIGVVGTGGSSGGAGVAGTGGTGGTGVVGTGGSSGGAGVAGTGGIGVLAQASGTGVTALDVHGPAVFSRSGTPTVAAGKSSATVTGVALTAASLVLAVVQQNLSGVYVRAAVPNVTGSSFTVYLSKAPTASAKVGWFVVN